MRPTELVEEKLEMPLAQPIGGAGLHEPFARILADRFEEAVPALAGALAVDHHQRLADEPRQQIEHVVLVDAVASAHLLGGVERPRGRKHRQPAEQLPFDIRQQLVTPVHGRLERPLPCDGRSRAAGQQPEPVLQPRLDLLRREDDDAGGRQLDGERNPVETPADARDRAGVAGVGAKAGSTALARVDEELRGLGVDERRRR